MIKRVFNFYRISEWFYFISFSFWGYLTTKGIEEIDVLLLLGLIVISMLYLAHGYALNDLFDGELRQRTEFSYRQSLFLVWCPILISVILTFLVNSVELLFFILLGAGASYLYSGKPFRMKNIPGVELILNAVCFLVVFFFGVVIEKNMSSLIVVIGTHLFILLVIFQLVHEVADEQEDYQKNIHNTLYYLGGRRAFQLSVLLCFVLAGHAFFFGGVKGTLLAVTAVVFSFFLLKLIVKKNSYLKKRARRLGGIYGLILFVISSL